MSTDNPQPSHLSVTAVTELIDALRAATGLDPQILEKEEINLAADIALATTTQSYEPSGGGDLPAPVYAVPFKSPGGAATVAFYYALPTTEVSVLPRPAGGSQIDYRYQLVVTGPDQETASREEDDVTVGHRVVLHACTIGNACLIGMGSILLDDVVTEDLVMIGAGSIVTPGKRLESRGLYVGSPARRVRELQPQEIEFLTYSARHYVKLKDEYLKERG